MQAQAVNLREMNPKCCESAQLLGAFFLICEVIS